jgi:hypothetical protein
MKNTPDKNDFSRRYFIQSIAIAGIAMPFISFGNNLPEESMSGELLLNSNGQLLSDFMKIELKKDQPGFSFLSIDSLGKKKLSLSPIRPGDAATGYNVIEKGNVTEYRFAGSPEIAPPAWSFEIVGKVIKLQSNFTSENTPKPLVLNFNPDICHVTLLGLLSEYEQKVQLPAIMHFPDMGSFKISSSKGSKVSLGFDAKRYGDKPFVEIVFEGGTSLNPKQDYILELVAIHPSLGTAASDPRMDGFKRNFINIFQLNPRLKSLANHSSSDITPITIHKYAHVALHTPKLADNLTMMDVVQQTLDRYINGMKGYCQVGYDASMANGADIVPWPMPYDSTDATPGILICAAYCYEGTKDKKWLENSYPKLKAFASKMMERDVDNDGLIEFEVSGNANSYNKGEMRTSCWWDAIGFGHKDAYGNAMVYHSLQGMSKLAAQIGKTEDAKLFDDQAKKIKSVYYKTFYNPETGVLAGWKSQDGKLHDYYFTFISAYAVYYGLVDHAQGNALMDKLFQKMKAVGYTNFELGLPGNLIPVLKEDYIPVGCCGAPTKDDGTDTFQVYQNGGATACHVYYTIEALYKLGRKKEAEAILFPMLKSFEDGKFQGKGANGKTNDWKRWDGTPEGYEGLLVDGYMALMSVLTMIKK